MTFDAIEPVIFILSGFSTSNSCNVYGSSSLHSPVHQCWLALRLVQFTYSGVHKALPSSQTFSLSVKGSLSLLRIGGYCNHFSLMSCWAAQSKLQFYVIADLTHVGTLQFNVFCSLGSCEIRLVQRVLQTLRKHTVVFYCIGRRMGVRFRLSSS